MSDRPVLGAPGTRGQKLFVLLAGVFLTGLVLADTTGGKLFQVGEQILSVGVIPFFVTFLVTDLINEFYGKKAARFVTFVAFGMAAIVLPILLVQSALPVSPVSPVSSEAFDTVFLQSVRIWVGSLTAFLVGQLIDIQAFHWLRGVTESRFLWLRATGSTLISQWFDTVVVLFIFLYGKDRGDGTVWRTADILPVCRNNYLAKAAIALVMTAPLYLVHRWIRRYLDGDRPSPLGAASLATASLEEAERR